MTAGAGSGYSFFGVAWAIEQWHTGAGCVYGWASGYGGGRGYGYGMGHGGGRGYSYG